MYIDLTSHDQTGPLPLELKVFLERNFHALPPFSPLALDFCAELSKLFADDEDPDIAALGFWLRPAHLHEIKEAFKASKGSIRVSKGLAFHITASNVDTLFAYSWIVSLLVGNGNIVRLPTKQSKAIENIVRHINNVLEQSRYAGIADTTCLLRYAHQQSITAAISSKADIRILWGSNPTVEAIRTIPLNPYAKDIAFPDRFSYSAIAALPYQALDFEEKERLAKAFFRDAYGFDQHGCSSPRLIFWIGQAEDCNTAAKAFYNLLQEEIVRRKYQLPLSQVLQKKTVLNVLCANLPVQSVIQASNELTVVDIPARTPLSRLHPGGGLFYHVAMPELEELTRFASTQDQTLTYFGFHSASLERLVRHLNGIGPKRFIPIGEALHFSPIWDGMDLLLELTNCIAVELTYSSIKESGL